MFNNVSLITWWIILIDILTLNQPWILGINFTWLWCSILFIYHWIWFAIISVRVFAILFMNDVSLNFFFLLPGLLSKLCCPFKWGWKIFLFSLFFRRIYIISYYFFPLNVWQNHYWSYLILELNFFFFFFGQRRWRVWIMHSIHLANRGCSNFPYFPWLSF